MLREAVMLAGARPEVREGVARIYAELQQEIDTRRPRCETSGRCCRFEEFGHRLYVTTIELAAFVHAMPLPGTPGRGVGERGSVRADSDFGRSFVIECIEPLSPEYQVEGAKGCPFQVNGLCGVHAIRPFGCRVFFCDASSDAWQHAQYERFHRELKRLHDELGVPYRYLEWREALELLDLPLAASRSREPAVREAASGNHPRRLSLPQLPL